MNIDEISQIHIADRANTCVLLTSELLLDGGFQKFV